MKIRSLAIGALALLLPLGVVACGGKDDTNSGSRPSVSELQKAFRAQMKDEMGGDDGMMGDAADCLAEKLHESDLPNGVLRAIADGRDAEIDKDNEDKYENVLEQAQNDCIEALVGDLELPEAPENE